MASGAGPEPPSREPSAAAGAARWSKAPGPGAPAASKAAAATAAAPGGRQARAHLGSGRGPRLAQVTRLAHRPPSSTLGPRAARSAAPHGFRYRVWGSRWPRRRAASERTSRRLGLPFAHFLDSRHDPLDIIFGPAPGLGSNRPARHGSGGEREAVGSAPAGSCSRSAAATLAPARSLTRTDTHTLTHTHTHTHTHKACRRRAPGAQCASAGRQLHRAGGAAPPRPPAVRPPGAAATATRPRSRLDPRPRGARRPRSPVRGRGGRADSLGRPQVP
jgi:hypothetical protein